MAKGKALAATVASIIAFFGWYEFFLDKYFVPLFNQTPQVAQDASRYLLLAVIFTGIALLLWAWVIKGFFSPSESPYGQG